MVPASITHLETWRRPAPKELPVPASGRVADVMNVVTVRIPSWFTVAQARGVAQLKKVDHLLVEERGQIAGSVGLAVLAQAPATAPVARWMTRSAAHLGPDLSVAEASRFLGEAGVSCLPVVRGGLLLGTVSLDDLGGAIAHAA
jgi:Mg/Co/Ni transporter MgtE